MLLFYQELKDEVKNELAKIEWSDDLNDMIKIIIWIDNCLWEKQQKRKKQNKQFEMLKKQKYFIK